MDRQVEEMLERWRRLRDKRRKGVLLERDSDTAFSDD